MFLKLCFSVTLHDERGDSNQMLLEPCFSVTLHGRGSNQMLLEQCFSMRPQDDTA